MNVKNTLFCAMLIFVAIAATGPAHAAQPSHLVVFNRPGTSWDDRALPEMRAHIDQHVKIYRDLAESGDIVVGGRFEGAPVLGISVVRTGIDTESVREHLKADPAVKHGIIDLEFRTWQIQMGAISEPKEVISQ